MSVPRAVYVALTRREAQQLLPILAALATARGEALPGSLFREVERRATSTRTRPPKLAIEKVSASAIGGFLMSQCMQPDESERMLRDWCRGDVRALGSILTAGIKLHMAGTSRPGKRGMDAAQVLSEYLARRRWGREPRLLGSDAGGHVDVVGQLANVFGRDERAIGRALHRAPWAAFLLTSSEPVPSLLEKFRDIWRDLKS